MTDAIALQGHWKFDGYQVGRLVNECEYITPKGGTLSVPMWAAQSALQNGIRFGGKGGLYTLRDCRYVRTVGRRVYDGPVVGNLITNEGLEGVAKMLIDSSATYDTGIKRVEIGDGQGAAVTPTVDATALVDTASVRYACNAPTQSAGVITVVTPTTTSDNGIDIQEAGAFIANDTGTRAAGDLLSFVAYDYDNSGTPVDLTITIVIDLTRLTGA